ncbi:MAG: hypothetical protein PF569_06915 [Candidatus Woesearchaeota archaeon]|jgi:ribosomal protein S24E|nr:hypothetical protein [Candidatus Woesearchaeota archaeon]
MVEIVKNVENKLLGRLEVEALIPNTGATISRENIKKDIAKKLKVSADLVIINHAGSYYGDTQVRVRAKVYDSKESLEKNARPHMVKRNSAAVVVAEGEE